MHAFRRQSVCCSSACMAFIFISTLHVDLYSSREGKRDGCIHAESAKCSLIDSCKVRAQYGLRGRRRILNIFSKNHKEKLNIPKEYEYPEGGMWTMNILFYCSDEATASSPSHFIDHRKGDRIHNSQTCSDFLRIFNIWVCDIPLPPPN